jgi:hypothetical protein
MTENGSLKALSGQARKALGKVDSSTRVNVAFPFSQVKIQEPSDRLIALTALVEELAELVARTAPGPEADQLLARAHDLVDRLA